MQALLATPIQAVMVTRVEYPEIHEFRKKGAYHFRTLEEVQMKLTFEL